MVLSEAFIPAVTPCDIFPLARAGRSCFIGHCLESNLAGRCVAYTATPQDIGGANRSLFGDTVESTHVDVSYDPAPETQHRSSNKGPAPRLVPRRGQCKMSSSTGGTSCREEYVGSLQENSAQNEGPLATEEASPEGPPTATVSPAADDAAVSTRGGDDTAYEADASEGNPTANASSARVNPPARSDLDGDRMYRFVRENHQKLKYGDTPPASDTSDCPNTETRSYGTYITDLMNQRAQSFSSGSSDL